MSTTAIILLIILGFLLLVAALLSLFLPGEWKTESIVSVDATRKMIFKQLNTSKNWENWLDMSPKFNEGVTIETGKTEEGAGAIQQWKSLEMEGSLTIQNSQPEDHVQYLINFDGQPFNVHATIQVSSINETHNVIWVSKLHMKQLNPFARIKGVALKPLVQEIQEKSLIRLKAYLENY